MRSATAWPRLVLVAALLVSGAASGCFQSLTGGQSAPYDFIRDSPYSSLLIEVDYVRGAQPHDAALSMLRERASERLSKPDGISLQATAFDGGRSTWSVNDLKDAEKEHRTFRESGSRAVLYVLYVDGSYSQDTSDTRVLGVHYGPTSIAIFKDNIRASSFTPVHSFGQREVEQSVLVHEFGHAIGLVDNGIPMQTDHEDPDHPHHSRNQQSVMYWKIETSDILAFLQPPPNQFDSNDIADVRAAGGK